ncbi:hypothetical protein ABLI39_04365 [Pseudarthrobacter sp. B907]|uniref:hypothetical protein n=1 Tax=Pseudarthrobacter sp. B907 TaxID=3158261 RepID=UPI0032DA09B4
MVDLEEIRRTLHRTWSLCEKNLGFRPDYPGLGGRSFALATCLASMKNTYTKTPIRISCPSRQVNGPGALLSEILSKDCMNAAAGVEWWCIGGVQWCGEPAGTGH